MIRNTPEQPRNPHEGALRAAAIETIRDIRNYYLEWDQKNLPPNSRLPFPKKHYVIEALHSEATPGIQHHQIAMIPAPEHPPIDGIKLVYLRMLTPYYDREDWQGAVREYERLETPQWNDVFIELIGDDERQIGKYLLNGAGLNRYETIQASGRGVADVVRNYYDYEQSGDLFMAALLQSSVPDTFDIYSLQAVLQDYIPVMQANN